MTREQLCEIISSLATNEDNFSQYAYQHIKESLNEWDDNIGFDKHLGGLSMEDENIAINYNAYWLFKCKDEPEVKSLLKMWYDK